MGPSELRALITGNMFIVLNVFVVVLFTVQMAAIFGSVFAQSVRTVNPV